VFKILQYSQIECICVRKIPTGMFRKYNIGRRPPKFWDPRLQPIEPIGKSGTEHHKLNQPSHDKNIDNIRPRLL